MIVPLVHVINVPIMAHIMFYLFQETKQRKLISESLIGSKKLTGNIAWQNQDWENIISKKIKMKQKKKIPMK